MQNLDPKIEQLIRDTAEDEDISFEEAYHIIVSNFNWLRKSMTNCEYPAYRIPHLGVFKMFDYRPKTLYRLKKIEDLPIYQSYAKWNNSRHFTDGNMMYKGKHNVTLDHGDFTKGILSYKTRLDHDADYLKDFDDKIRIVNELYTYNVVCVNNIIKANEDDLPEEMYRVAYVNNNQTYCRWNMKFALCSFNLDELTKLLKLVKNGKAKKANNVKDKKEANYCLGC